MTDTHSLLPAPDAARVGEALARLVARAGAQVPATGAFEPLVERCAIAHPGHAAVREVVLRIGPGQGDGAGRRFYDVRVRTADEASDSSAWLHFLERDALLAALREARTGLDATLVAIDDAVASLAGHGLR